MHVAALSQGTPYHQNKSRDSLFRSSIAEQDEATLFCGGHELRPGFRGMFHSEHYLSCGHARNILAVCAPENSLNASSADD
jgi:hypothetical protein